jgi:hypothetical protein
MYVFRIIPGVSNVKQLVPRMVTQSVSCEVGAHI